MHFFSIIVGTLVLAPFVSGCSIKSCTLAGCHTGISVEISDMPEARSSLVITVTVDGVPTVCSSTVEEDVAPAEGGAGGGGGSSNPPAERPEITCEGPLADSIYLYGNHGGHFLIAETPDNARLKLEIDGSTVLDKDLDPKYETVRPNGPDCAPVCEVAAYRLSLE